MPPLQKFIWVLLILGWHVCPAQPGKGLRAYVFLSPECPLCQNYTRTLNRLEQQYAGKLSFYGIIPGKTYTKEDVAAFKGKYHVGFSLVIDRDLHIVHELHATTTPEVILLAADNTVLYQGAIDNWYKSLGRAGRGPTQNYLQDAIDAALRNATPSIRKTTPVGCLINDF